jgi:hypothetical protein
MNGWKKKQPPEDKPMNDSPSLLIQFDETWTPTVFINGQTDEETAILRQIADRMLANVEVPQDEN